MSTHCCVRTDSVGRGLRGCLGGRSFTRFPWRGPGRLRRFPIRHPRPRAARQWGGNGTAPGFSGAEPLGHVRGGGWGYRPVGGDTQGPVRVVLLRSVLPAPPRPGGWGHALRVGLGRGRGGRGQSEGRRGRSRSVCGPPSLPAQPWCEGGPAPLRPSAGGPTPPVGFWNLCVPPQAKDGDGPSVSTVLGYSPPLGATALWKLVLSQWPVRAGPVSGTRGRQGSLELLLHRRSLWWAAALPPGGRAECFPRKGR